ncbi:unnamed protein product [Sympodiomycopsis kandeliae]
MFGICIAGRLPQTATSQPDETHLVFALENMSSINHITVFMDGSTPFPAGYSATIHISTTPQGQPQEWRLLGCLKNDKPSAIFRLKSMASSVTSTGMLGISIETEEGVNEQMARLSSSTEHEIGASAGSSTGPSTALVRAGNSIDPQMALLLAPKIANNIFSYLSSFAPDSAPQTISLLQKWLEQFQRKLKMQGSEFLERQHD